MPFHQGLNPRGNSERSWLGFVSRMNGLLGDEVAAFSQSHAFLESIEKIDVTRSHKIILLLAMIAADAMPGEIGIDKLVEQVAKLAARYLKVRKDFSVDIHDSESLRHLLVDQPVRALVGGQGTGDISYFRFESGRLSTTFEASDAGSLKELLREVLDWRLAHYLSGQALGDAVADIVCRVSRAGERPILFLPSAAAALHLELGPVPVAIDGTTYEALIASIAINVVRKPGEAMNLLPEILRRWFGDDAGLPGRGERIKLKRGSSGFEMEALRTSVPQEGLQVWGRYARDAIAPAFGLTFSQAIWNAGFVVQDPEVFPLVTLAKDDMSTEHRYVDHFESDREFAWQSQNRTKRDSKHGQILSNHVSQGKRVHLFVRPTKKTGSKPTPFLYCGEVDFVSWEGDAPISIKWRLREAVPPALRGALGVPS